MLDPGPDAPSLRPTTTPDPVIAGLGRALLAALHLPPNPGERLFADGVRDALLAHLGQRHATVPRPVQRLSPTELDRVHALVDADLTAALRVADLARVVPMSPAHFSRSFHQATGSSPYAYVLRRRVEGARRLLTREPLGLDEVARRTGFADAGHLARQFRRHVGTTPAAYRRAVRGT